MANHKSAIKRIRQSETRRLRNRYYSKTMRNAVAKEATEAMPKVTAMLDKLAGKNVISKNKAANLKSKLAQHINKLNQA